MKRQPMTKTEKTILASATGVAAAAILTTLILGIRARNTEPVNATVTDRFESICIAGAYERTNGRMVVDMFAPTIGVETIEDVSKETYDQIIEEIGTCQ